MRVSRGDEVILAVDSGPGSGEGGCREEVEEAMVSDEDDARDFGRFSSALMLVLSVSRMLLLACKISQQRLGL